MPDDEGTRVAVERDPQREMFARTEYRAATAAPGFTGARFEGTRAVQDLEDAGLSVRLDKRAVSALVSQRLDAVTQVHRTLEGVRQELVDFFPALPEALPPFVDGRLFNPDASPAAHVQVRALEPLPDPAEGNGHGGGSGNGNGGRPGAFEGVVRPWPLPTATTDARGAYRLALPPRPVPAQGLRLQIVGSDRQLEIVVKRSDLVSSAGSLGVQPLPQPVAPLRRSVVSQLKDVVPVPTSEQDVLADPGAFATPAPAFTLGEGDCARSFRSNTGVIEQFGFSMLVRLVAPQLSGRRLGARVRFDDRRSTLLSSSSTGLLQYVPADDVIGAIGTMASWELVERVPVESPIDVTRFREMIERAPALVPKAATLGLGYVVRMQQVWLPTGMSLSDIVYSLPLAPGEQQRIVVAEERETLSVREAEAMTAEEYQRYQEVGDTSSSATFRSAFDEAASGGSSMRTRTEAGSVGGGLGVGGFFSGIVAGLGIAGGYSDSTTTGSSSSWQKASRDYVSNAAQDFHSSLSRQAAARRSANRTSVRMASATERTEVVSKVITNHNHCHALTMQYWQVLRHFAVSTKVDDVQLVCFVPLELVQFLPSGEPRTLATGAYSRDQLLQRYGMLLRYHDVLAARLRRSPEMMHGLRVLRSFAGNPTMAVQSSSGAAQDVVNVSFRGTFLPFEDVYVTAVSTTGARVGPVRLDAASPTVAAGLTTRAAVLQALRERRQNQFETRTGAIALPEYLARSDVARFEFSRAFNTFAYRLSLPSGLSFTDILGYLGNVAALDVTLSPAELEREFGGPVVNDPRAQIGGAIDLLEAYNGPGGTDRMGATMPVAARRLPPVLAFADVLRVEAVLQHVVTNTVTYSKAVWEALTPEERAILLERYTIGAPAGGAADPGDEVPLLNCVANEVLGYFGNCAVMPFFIPVTLARAAKVSSRDVQEALLKFHRQAFVPPQSTITLPARGVLGEAILGTCNACEKIDLTRFWNWQDSPADAATDPAQLAALLGRGNALVGPNGAAAPATLQSSPMITINQGPTAFTPGELAKALIDKLPASNLPQNLTGLAELAGQMKVQTESTAESLNKTIAEASGLAKKAMETVPKAIEARNKTASNGAGGSGGGGGTGGGGTGGGDLPPIDAGPAPSG